LTRTLNNYIEKQFAAKDKIPTSGEDAREGLTAILSVKKRCVAFNNGWLSNSREGGPIGIWAHDSNDITIQHNESYDNRTGGKHDGGGFDLDGGVTNSVVQYNYAHGNDGAGYLLAQYDKARPFERNVVRFNISENDGRKNAYGAIHGFGDLGKTDVYNNTVYLEPSDCGRPAGIVLSHGSQLVIRVLNNIFQTVGGVPCARVSSSDGVMFAGNNYHSGEGPLAIEWGSVSYDSVGAWSSATGQEQQDGASCCQSVDPQLRSPGAGGTLGDAPLLETLDAYQLTPASPLIGAGIDLEAIGVDPGARDYYGTALQRCGGSDVGAPTSDIGAHTFDRRLFDSPD
jgi:hypothetical protein